MVICSLFSFLLKYRITAVSFSSRRSCRFMIVVVIDYDGLDSVVQNLRQIGRRRRRGQY